MRKILVFETNTGKGGHHLEYVHHLYMNAISKANLSFVFAVSEKIRDAGKELEWPVSDNIQMDFISEERISNIRQCGRVRGCVMNAILLKEYVKKHNPEEVFLISLINFMPILPFILPSSVRCSGIIYKIYLYLWKESSVLKKLANVFIYSIFAKCKFFSRVFILNDSSSSVYLNRLYKTNKFCYLPDPIVNYFWTETDIRKKYQIDATTKVFLQCGILSSRKFSLEVLEALKYVDAKGLCFVFAGKVSSDIKEEFYSLVNELSSSHQIIVEDDYLSYDLMFSLLKNADYVFTLYRETSLSSGFIGHAANFSRPVISRPDGLIGKLVKKNHLGYIVKSMDSKSLAQSILYILHKSNTINSDYVKTHSPISFAQFIIQE